MLRNINRSGARYLLSTSFPRTNNTRARRHFRAGAAFSSFWPVNLQDAPFHLPRPLLAVGKDGAGNARDGQRVLGLWPLPLWAPASPARRRRRRLQSAAAPMASPPPVHVTYLALGGGGDGGAVFEAARSAFSLCRLAPKASVLLVTNAEALAATAAAQLKVVCPQHRVSVITLRDEQVLATLRAANFTHLYGHQSGPGGYAKLVPTDWLPASVERTLLIDTDTLFARDPSAMWNRTFTRFGSGQLLAMTPFVKQGFGCVRTQRPTGRAQFNQEIQFGRAAPRRGGDAAARLGGDRRPDAVGGAADAGRARLLVVCPGRVAVRRRPGAFSLVCASTKGACGNLPPNAHCDRCGNTDRGRRHEGRSFTTRTARRKPTRKPCSARTRVPGRAQRVQAAGEAPRLGAREILAGRRVRVGRQRQRPHLQRSSGQLDGVPEDGARAAAVQRRELGAARGGSRLGVGFCEAVEGQGHW